MSVTAQELELARQHDTPLATQDTEPTSILNVIERACRDPSVDVDKLDRLLQMSERVQAREAKVAYTRSFVKMKPLLPTIERDGKIVILDKADKKTIIQSTPYARWEDIDEAITPILEAHGFALSFRSGVAADGKLTVTGILSHNEGHSEETTMTLPHDSTGSKNSVQAVGSSFSYGRRYTATMLLNIRTKGQDDDGRKAGEDDPISEEQIEKLMTAAQRFASFDQVKFCKYMGVEMIADIRAKDFDKAMTAINSAPRKGEQK